MSDSNNLKSTTSFCPMMSWMMKMSWMKNPLMSLKKRIRSRSFLKLIRKKIHCCRRKICPNYLIRKKNCFQNFFLRVHYSFLHYHMKSLNGSVPMNRKRCSGWYWGCGMYSDLNLVW